MQSHPLGRALFASARREGNVLHTDLRLLKCHFLSLRYDGVRRRVSGVVGRRSWEMLRDGGYRGAIPGVISAGETNLTQMKRVTRKGYGNETRKTDGKNTTTHRLPALLEERRAAGSSVFVPKPPGWFIPAVLRWGVTQHYPPLCPHCTLVTLTAALTPPSSSLPLHSFTT